MKLQLVTYNSQLASTYITSVEDVGFQSLHCFISNQNERNINLSVLTAGIQNFVYLFQKVCARSVTDLLGAETK